MRTNRMKFIWRVGAEVRWSERGGQGVQPRGWMACLPPWGPDPPPSYLSPSSSPLWASHRGILLHIPKDSTLEEELVGEGTGTSPHRPRET